jgi:hypothetical protein
MDKIEKIINTPMSDNDIKKYMPVMRYNDFDGRLPAIILYEEIPGYGHWAMIHESIDTDGNKCYEFFDSYGMWPDKALKIIGSGNSPKIVKWLMDSNKRVAYSNDKLQGSGPNIMTCGRHCIVRHMFSNYSAETYSNALKKIAKDLSTTPDHIVSIIIPS